MGRIVIALHAFAEPHQTLVDERGGLFTLGVMIECAASLFGLGQSELGRSCTFAFSQSYYTFAGREILVGSILEQVRDLEAIVMIDGDMAFSPKDFEELVADGRRLGGIVGAFYPSRQRLDEWIGTAVDEDPRAAQSGVPVPATYVGNGFCWVPAGVFRSLANPWYTVGWHDGKYEFEDQGFCRRVLQSTPYKIWGRSFEGVSHDFRMRRNMRTVFVQGGF